MADKEKKPSREFNASQKAGWQLLEEYPFVALVGPAGTGKTHLAIEFAGKQVRKKAAEKIIFVRSPVEMGRSSLGYLPGDANAKMSPYVSHAEDIAKDIGILKDAITVVPLGYVQGRTFNNSIVIVDECQTFNIEEFRGIFTRLGKDSKMIFCGDPAQDSRHRGQFRLFLERAATRSCFAVQQFTQADNMRHPAINELLDAVDDL